MTRIAAALVWYDESPEFLTRCVESLVGVVDTLVSADGAWELYPDGKPESPAEQREALHAAVVSTGLTHASIDPLTIWPSQVAKRSEVYGMAAAMSDWFLVIDGDEWVKSQGCFREKLATVERDVCQVLMAPREGARFLQRRRRVFRALPGLHVMETHNGIVTGDGRWLAGPRRIKSEPAADLTRELLLGHSFRGRSDARNANSRSYYEARKRLRVEVH